jgi:peptide deformylase
MDRGGPLSDVNSVVMSEPENEIESARTVAESPESDGQTAEVGAEASSDSPLDEETLRKREEALAQVVQYGDPVLKSKASPVTEFDDALAEEIERMIGLMRDGLGVGLAATQVGKLKRLLVFQTNSDAQPQALINPEIEWLSEDSEIMSEGCLSIPRVVVDVERPLYARVRGQDQSGGQMLIEASGHEARVLQHEIDHLDGVLILDRTERAQRKGALKALRRGESFSPLPDDDES